jgi:hypothetical protein
MPSRRSSAIRTTGLLDALAARTMLEEQPYAFHGRLLQRNLAATRRPYSALLWGVVQVIAKLEKDVA